MWTRVDIEHPDEALAALRPRLDALPSPWRENWSALDDAREAARVLDELRTSLADWTRAMTKAPAGARLAAVSLYYAGAEIAPHLPQDVWADGLAEVKRDGDSLRRGARLFREHAAFALCVVGEHLAALGKDEAFHDSPDGEALARALVLRTLVWLRAALPRLRAEPAFAALPVTDDFVFLASPGHDEPWAIVG
ncbi:MAG: hypothetical protein AB1730_21095 [Myxococcota bacterium]|jgi:hypothetical protein